MVKTTRKKNKLFDIQVIIKNLQKKLKKDPKLVILGIIIIFFIINSVIFIVWNYALNKKLSRIKLNVEKSLVAENQNQIIDNNVTAPELVSEIQKNGISRYFLTETERINNHYVPRVYLCLFNNGEPIYPRYVYENWALLNYPNDLNPEIQLIKLILLPQDNNNFQLNKDCFLKEIKTAKDWQEVEEKYGFSLNKF
jgi:hypothetical protein